MPDETFYFDEFFTDEGVEILLPVRGRRVPIRIRRGLTLREKASAESAALKRTVDLTTGRITIQSVDETAAAEEIAFRMILSWPFINRDGSPVPVTRENVSKLLGGMDQLVRLSQKLETEGESALIPFAAHSGQDSETPVQPE